MRCALKKFHHCALCVVRCALTQKMKHFLSKNTKPLILPLISAVVFVAVLVANVTYAWFLFSGEFSGSDINTAEVSIKVIAQEWDGTEYLGMPQNGNAFSASLNSNESVLSQDISDIYKISVQNLSKREVSLSLIFKNVEIPSSSATAPHPHIDTANLLVFGVIIPSASTELSPEQVKSGIIPHETSPLNFVSAGGELLKDIELEVEPLETVTFYLKLGFNRVAVLEAIRSHPDEEFLTIWNRTEIRVHAKVVSKNGQN